MKKVLLSLVLVMGVSSAIQPLSLPTAEAASVKTFKDVKGHSAQFEIEALVEIGALGAYADGSFKPDEPITRVQFSKALAVLMNVESKKLAFSDMKANKKAKYVNGLVEKKVIIPKDYAKGYKPNAKITRLEMSKMVSRALASESSSWKDVLSGINKLDIIDVPFKDKKTLKASDLQFVALANGSGIVNARKNGNFDANGLTTRGEAAVMLNRYLEVKVQTPSKSKLVNKFKGEKSIHDYSKAELNKWINREADLKRLSKYPIVNEFFDTLAECNYFWVYPNNRDRSAYFQKEFAEVSAAYMNTYYNRDYRTIGADFIKDIRFHFRTGYTHKGVYYSNKDLGKLFNKFVEETKKEKTISESIFVTDVTMYYKYRPKGQMLHEDMDRIRGTQYIRYTSGTNLPKGVKLNKWYKRDVEVVVFNPTWNEKIITWDTAMWVHKKEIPITSYKEVKK